MTTQRRTLWVGSPKELEALREPIDGIVLEDASGPDRFALSEGPFSHYERHLEITRTEAAVTGGWEVTETTTWKLGIPFFWILYWVPVWFHIRGGQKNPSPWWAPAGRFDTRAARVIGLLGIIAIINGFLGTIIGQTLTFAADEFCNEFALNDEGISTCVDEQHDRSARANVFTIVRIGILLSLVLAIVADRVGRRLALTVAVTVSCLAAALGAVSPSFQFLAGTQTVSRGLATGVAILIAVIATEELPTKSRAYGLGMLILLAGLGSGMVVWILPAADVAVWGWRIVYGFAAIFIPLALWAGRQLPTTRRFQVLERQPLRESLAELWTDDTMRNRLILLGASALLGAIFSTPASQFDNQFLRDELGFSASRITFFTLLTSTPIGLGVLGGGILADRIGRRPIGALGTAIGVVMTVASFFSNDVVIFPVRAIGVVLGVGLAVAGLAVYGPELFPTRLRSTANGLITACAVAGSVIGLQLVGRLAERFDAFGPALAIAGLGPAVVVILVLTKYPETANRTLEDLNDEPELS